MISRIRSADDRAERRRNSLNGVGVVVDRMQLSRASSHSSMPSLGVALCAASFLNTRQTLTIATYARTRVGCYAILAIAFWDCTNAGA